jgi:hypothetical protein
MLDINGGIGTAATRDIVITPRIQGMSTSETKQTRAAVPAQERTGTSVNGDLRTGGNTRDTKELKWQQ